MNTHSPIVRRTFRLSVDIETALQAEADETRPAHAEQAQFQQALVQQLQAHPAVLDRLLRASAVAAFKSAQKLFAVEYGWERVSEQETLRPLIEELEPTAQAYFTEELEDGVTVFYFDGCQTTIKGFDMTELP